MTELLPQRRAVMTARTSAAWTRHSGAAVIRCTGTDRIDFLHRLTTNDMTKLLPEHGIQTVIVTEKARIIDVVMVLQGQDDAVLIGSNDCSSQIVSWLRKYVITDDVRFVDRTHQQHCLEIMGPHAAEVVEGLLGIDCSRWALGTWTHATIEGGQIVVARMASSCEVSYWIVGDTDPIEAIVTSLRANEHAVPELRDIDARYVRILSGMGCYDHEWSEAYNPLEAGLLHLTSFTKGCYIGQEVIARLDSYNKVKQRIMGIVAPARLDVGDVLVIDEHPVGVVTSVVQSCNGIMWLALGYVRGQHAVSNTPISVQSEHGLIVATQYLPPIVDVSCL